MILVIVPTASSLFVRSLVGMATALCQHGLTSTSIFVEIVSREALVLATGAGTHVVIPDLTFGTCLHFRTYTLTTVVECFGPRTLCAWARTLALVRVPDLIVVAIFNLRALTSTIIIVPHLIVGASPLWWGALALEILSYSWP